MEEIVSPSLSRDKLEAAALKANEQRLGPSAIAGLQVHKRKRGGSVRTTRTANIVPGERKSGPADVVYIDYHASNKASIAYESTGMHSSSIAEIRFSQAVMISLFCSRLSQMIGTPSLRPPRTPTSILSRRPTTRTSPRTVVPGSTSPSWLLTMPSATRSMIGNIPS